jgi:Winged helix DNA-binding domain
VRTLGERHLNRALLARQLLLERADLSLPRAVERIGGLQTQYAPSAYIGAWSRLSGFDRDALTRALERGTLVQATLMRMTIHIVSRRDYWPIAIGLREPRRTWWLAVSRHAHDDRAMRATAERVRGLLANGPRRRNDICAALDLDAQTWNGVGLWIDLVRVPPSGTWERRRADLYGLAEHHVGPEPEGLTEHDGRALLVRRYLAAFGPASRKDIASFTGLPAAALAPVLDGLKLRSLRDEDGGELLDVPRAPLPDPETPAPVRFLPTWDATLLAHARRTQILPERFRSLVFHTRTPQSVPTFTVDGRVAGTWREDRGRVTPEPFEPLPASAMRAVRAEADRLESFLA